MAGFTFGGEVELECGTCDDLSVLARGGGRGEKENFKVIFFPNGIFHFFIVPLCFSSVYKIKNKEIILSPSSAPTCWAEDLV